MSRDRQGPEESSWRAHEPATPWWSDPGPAPASKPDITRDTAVGGGESAGSPVSGRAADRLAAAPEAALWAGSLAPLVAAAVLAAAASSSLVIPTVAGAILIGLLGAIRLAAHTAGLVDAESGTAAAIPGIAAMMIGWVLGAWMLSSAVSLLVPASALGPGRAGAAALAVIGAFSLPALTVALGLRKRRLGGADASFALRLGGLSACITVVAAAALVLLVTRP